MNILIAILDDNAYMKVQSKIKNALKNLQYDCQNRKVEKKLKNFLESRAKFQRDRRYESQRHIGSIPEEF